MKIRDRILIIEDEANISSFIATILEANDYDALTARKHGGGVLTFGGQADAGAFSVVGGVCQEVEPSAGGEPRPAHPPDIHCRLHLRHLGE